MSFKRIIMFASRAGRARCLRVTGLGPGHPCVRLLELPSGARDGPAHATMIQQGEQQITTATNTLSSLQKLTNVNSIAPQLLQPQIRNILPNTTIDASTLLSGDLTEDRFAGHARVANPVPIHDRRRPSSSSADAAYAQALKDCDRLSRGNGCARREHPQRIPDPDAGPRPAP